MTHTPGPWWACQPGTYGPEWNVEDSFGLTCKVYGDDDSAVANAHLIAAAPEMLAALCEARDAFAALNWEGDENWRHWDATRVDSLIAGTLRVVNQAIGLTKEGSDGEDRRMD